MSFDQEIQQQAAIIGTRVAVTYKFPEPMRKAIPSCPTSVSMRALTADEELTASKLGKLDYMRSQYAAAKLAITAVGGKLVTTSDGSTDAFWEAADPKVRSLILQAYNKSCSPDQEDEDSFFGSAEVSV